MKHTLYLIKVLSQTLLLNFLYKKISTNLRVFLKKLINKNKKFEENFRH